MTKQFVQTKLHCKFCNKEMDTSHRAYSANPFCQDKECYEKRLEASGAIDLRDNHEIIDLDNGYVQVKAIDPMKKFKAEIPNKVKN
jgi:hypothetical protein